MEGLSLSQLRKTILKSTGFPYFAQGVAADAFFKRRGYRFE
jgi:hypothetical protein